MMGMIFLALENAKACCKSCLHMMAGIKSCTWDTLIEVLENVKAADT